MSTKRKCCYLQDGKAEGTPCDADAEWELFGSSQPWESIDACTVHIGALLDDSPETRVFPIKSAGG
jgi:hypothetical protein